MSDKLSSIEDNEFEEVSLSESGNILTDENITQDQINEMKMLGIPKPDTVSWERWQQLQTVRHEHQHMIHLAASGVPQKQIAEILGYTNASVSKILNTPEIKQKVNAEVVSIYGEDHKKALKHRAMKAIGVVDEVLESGKESEQAAMAKWVLEHSIGKAQQVVEHKGTILSDVMIKIEQLNQLRDVTDSQALLTKTPHKFDTILEQIVPSGVVVGKRTNEQTE
jgi:predicted transcriptional regulator